MASEGGRRLSLVLRLRGGRVCGQWWEEDGPRSAVSVDGETEGIRWQGGLLERVLANLQMNAERDACRLLLCSDRPVEALPGLSNGWPWSLAEVAGEMAAERAGSWHLDGRSLDQRLRRLFPPADGGGNACYLYAVPPLEVPEKASSLADVVVEAFARQARAGGKTAFYSRRS